MDPEDIDANSPNSPGSPQSAEISMCPDYISSYTQISHFNNDETTGEQTDVESTDDEFSNDVQPDKGLAKQTKSALPELSSQIVEWSKKTFQSYKDSDKLSDLSENLPASSNESEAMDDRLQFFQMKFLSELESQAIIIAQNLNQIMDHISNFSAKATSTSVDVMKIYQDNVFEKCDNIDSNIKLMYKIISKCEELNKSLKFLDDLKIRIKNIKQTLDTFERII